MEERLDELLGMARELGHLTSETARLERAADAAPVGSTEKPRRHAREARKTQEAKAVTLSRARARFLASLPAEKAAEKPPATPTPKGPADGVFDGDPYEGPMSKKGDW